MKRQASFKEYTVTIADSGSAEVYKLFMNAYKGLQELCAANNLDCPKGYAAGTLGNRILKELNGGDANATSAVAGHYIISREPNDSIKVSKIYKNTSGALRELSELVGFDYDAKWGPRTFGNKVIDAIESGEFKKLAKLKKVEDTVEIEMDENATAETVAPQVVAQEIPADAIVLELKDPTEIRDDEFVDRSFKNIIIPKGVSRIGVSAFSYCGNLENVVIPNSVTEIHGSAFYQCDSLEHIVIPESVTEIGPSAFQECSSLKSITINMGVIKICRDAFSSCSSLDNVVIPDSVTVIENCAFSRCTSLKNIVIPDSVTEIGSAAFAFTALESVVIPDGVTEIGRSTFYGCSSLESVVIPKSVTKIGEEAFEGCNNLKSITIFRKIKKIIERIDLPEDCDVIIMKDDDAQTCEGKVFTTVDYEEMGSPENLEIPEGYTSIDDYAFEECEDLASVVIPEGVTHIGKSAFYNCFNLESVTLPNTLDTMGDFAFGGDDVCTMERDYEYDELEEDCGVLYNIGHTNILFVCGSPLCHDIEEETTSIGKKFNSCETLDSIDFCDSKVEVLEDHAFDGCCNMESVYLNNNLKKIGNNVFYCTKITELVIPNSVTEIGKNAFMECCSLAKITLPEMFKDKLSGFIVEEWGEVSLADEKYEVSFH